MESEVILKLCDSAMEILTALRREYVRQAATDRKHLGKTEVFKCKKNRDEK